jgi:antitoxin (DNA-binding transcriptional repressor) of toxin-antitoxin stability system
METQITINEARPRLSQLVDAPPMEKRSSSRAPAGRWPRLVAWRPRPVARKPGRMRGHIRVARDFDAPLPADLFQTDPS